MGFGNQMEAGMSREASLARRLAYAYYSVDQFLVAKGKEKKINYAELSILYGLDGGEPVSQKELAEQIFVPVTTINTIVKVWEKQGLLIQVPVEGKKREKHIILTEAGKQYAHDHLDYIYQAEEKAMKMTLEKYSADFVEALEFYGESLRKCSEENEEQGE